MVPGVTAAGPVIVTDCACATHGSRSSRSMNGSRKRYRIALSSRIVVSDRARDLLPDQDDNDQREPAEDRAGTLPQAPRFVSHSFSPIFLAIQTILNRLTLLWPRPF